MEAERVAASELTIFELPSFIINGAEFRGSNAFGPILTGICNAFMDETEPEICDTVLDPSGATPGDYALSVDVYVVDFSFLVHLLRGLTRVTYTTNNLVTP